MVLIRGTQAEDQMLHLEKKNPEINTLSYKQTHWFIYMCNTSRHSQWNNTTTVLGFIVQVVGTDSAVSSIKRFSCDMFMGFG